MSPPTKGLTCGSAEAALRSLSGTPTSICGVQAESFDIGRILAADRELIPPASQLPLAFRANFQDEAAPYRDKLGLSKLVNEALREVSARGTGATLVFVDAPPELADAYALEGRYKLEGQAVTVTVYLLRGSEQVGTFTTTGKTSAPEGLLPSLLAQTEKLLAVPRGESNQ